MRIAINTRFLLSKKMEGFGWYTYEVVKRMVLAHPEVEFYFFFDRPYDEKFLFASNVKPIIISPPARHPILFWIWFEIGIKKALKKYEIDLFFSPDGYLSLGSECPQVGVIHDINFEHFPEDIPFSARKYLRTFFPKFAKKATKILTVSEFSKQDICSTYALPSSKIEAIWNGVSEAFHPLSDEEIEMARNRFAQGRPYFLFVGALHPRKNIKRLIEAYKIYKSKKNNDFELIIVGTALWSEKDYTQLVPKEIQAHIHFTGHLQLDDLALAMGGASIFVFVPYFEGFGLPLVEAMRSNVPILAGNLTALPEVAGEAALYCNPMSIDSIYEGMQILADSPEKRETLKAIGLERSNLFSWDRTAKQVWEELKNVYESK
jgi:glycosyltransferase involved in cell wall biosynthesis